VRLATAGAALALAAVAPSTAVAAEAAAGPEAAIVAAENAFAQLAYEDAIKHAEAAIAIGGLSHDQLGRAYKVLALARAGTDQPDKARDAFVQLLTYDPDFALDASHGPKIQQPFLEARGFWRGQASRPGIDVSTILREDEGGTLRVTVRDPTHIVKRAVVAYRWGTAAGFKRVEATVGDQVVPVPAPPPGITRLDYFVQAFDAQSDAVFEVGNESVPRTALVDVVPRGARGGVTKKEETKGGGLFSSPIFWVVTGAIVAGGVTTGLILATKRTDTREEQLPPTRSNVGPIPFCGAERCR
jgi:hypothetical protein